jgi:hypothetical protein
MSLYGVPAGVSYGQNERVDELNDRLQTRQFSDKPLAPNFSGIPVPTKQSRFQIMDRRAPIKEHITAMEEHNVETNFSPATHRGPPSTFFTHVDVESGLRNQTVALQKGCIQSVYVPDSTSDLYKVKVPYSTGPNPHPELFISQTFRETTRIVGNNIGKDMFNNHTRTQLRGG